MLFLNLDASVMVDQCACPEGPQDTGIKFGLPYFHKNSLKVDLFISSCTLIYRSISDIISVASSERPIGL